MLLLASYILHQQASWSTYHLPYAFPFPFAREFSFGFSFPTAMFLMALSSQSTPTFGSFFHQSIKEVQVQCSLSESRLSPSTIGSIPHRAPGFGFCVWCFPLMVFLTVQAITPNRYVWKQRECVIQYVSFWTLAFCERRSFPKDSCFLELSLQEFSYTPSQTHLRSLFSCINILLESCIVLRIGWSGLCV